MDKILKVFHAFDCSPVPRELLLPTSYAQHSSQEGDKLEVVLQKRGIEKDTKITKAEIRFRWPD